VSAPAKTRWRASHWALLVILLIGGLAPVLANDVPLVASVGGKLQFPAFATYVGEPPPGPADKSWKQWWVDLRPADRDWALMPPWPYGPLETDSQHMRAGPDALHPLGSDDTGRDVLSRLVHGAGSACRVAGVAVVLGMLVGVLLGGLAGLCGGAVDFAVLRAIEICLCLPTLLLGMVAAALFGQSEYGVAVVLAFAFWTSFARVVRGELLALRERPFVLAARGLGLGNWQLLWRHVLPQLRGTIAVAAAFCAGQAVRVESTRSVLGLGPGKASSWGSVLAQGKANAQLGCWHLWLFPTLLLLVTVSALHGVAESVRRRRA